MKKTEKRKENRTKKIIERETKMVTATKFASCRCSICGTFIPEGDDTCEHGHVLGQQYG